MIKEMHIRACLQAVLLLDEAPEYRVGDVQLEATRSAMESQRKCPRLYDYSVARFFYILCVLVAYCPDFFKKMERFYVGSDYSPLLGLDIALKSADIDGAFPVKSFILLKKELVYKVGYGGEFCPVPSLSTLIESVLKKYPRFLERLEVNFVSPGMRDFEGWKTFCGADQALSAIELKFKADNKP